MALTQRYNFKVPGDGLYNPIRQTALKDKHGLLQPSISAKLYSKRKARPKAFASAITSRYNSADVVPSSFAQHGRGKLPGAHKGVVIQPIKPGSIDYFGMGVRLPLSKVTRPRKRLVS